MNRVTREKAIALVGQELINQLDNGWDFSNRVINKGMTEFCSHASNDKYSVTGYCEFDSEYFDEKSGKFVEELDQLDWDKVEYFYEIYE